MEDERRRQLAAAKSGKQVLDTNNVLWDSVTIRAAKRMLLGDHIVTIEGLDLIVTKDNKGFAIDKNQKKAIANTKALKVAKALTVFAKETNDPVLEQEINFEASDLLRASDEQAPVNWQLIFDRGTTHSAALIADYGLTAGDISAVNVARLSFLAAEPTSDAARAARTAANAMMITEFGKMSKTIETTKELAAVLMDSEPEIVKAINTAFKIDNIGGRIVDAVVTFKDEATGVLLPNVVLQVLETGSKKKSTKRGQVQLKGFENGNYTLKAIHPYYEENITANFAIQDGEINRLEIKLKKKPVEGGHGVVN
jgi:hypothetical protein